MWQFQYERLASAAACVGQAEKILGETIAYARERRAFGKAIADHQVIAHMLADAATELEAGRALLYATVWRILHGEYPVAEISMAKKYCAQMQNRLADTCLQVYGGDGDNEEGPVGRAGRGAPPPPIGARTHHTINKVNPHASGSTA